MGVQMFRMLLLAIASWTLSGCGATVGQLKARAAFDLDCPESQLTIVAIDDRTRGVRGCGSKAVYVETCRMLNNAPTDCTWVLNSDDVRR